MFLFLGEKGRKDVSHFFFSLGLVVASFAVVGYIPISLALNHLSNQGVVITEVSDLQKYFGLNGFFRISIISFYYWFYFTFILC